MLVRFSSLMICVLLLIREAGAQRAESALTAWSAVHPQERMYFHYDRDYYSSGQTIWFKTYLYHNWKPSGLSNNLYVQLTNEEGKVLTSGMFPVIGATVKGSLSIPEQTTQGVYYIRAFTPGSLKYAPGLLYNKRVHIYSPIANNKNAVSRNPSLSLQFYPESGDLLDNVFMNVGFKAVDENGYPAEVQGVIKLEDGTTIAPFQTYHDGIGQMQLKPRAGKKYMAEVQTSDGLKKFSLPEVKPFGVNLKIIDEKHGKKFLVTRRYKLASDFTQLVLIADIDNIVVYKMNIDLEGYTDAEGQIDTDSLPSGVLHFTVIDKNTRLPLCERLAFVNNNEYRANATINTMQVNLNKRAPNELEISFADSIIKTCSVSVSDAGSMDAKNRRSIYSELLLTPDVRGYVHNPAWYFDQQNDSTKKAIDNLLLTHGWSRYTWQEVLSNAPAKHAPEDPFLLTLHGRILDQRNGKPVSNGKVNVLVEEVAGRPSSFLVPVDDGGNFRIDSLVFFGDTKVYFDYMDKNNKDKPVTVELNKVNNADSVWTIAASLAFNPETGPLFSFAGIAPSEAGVLGAITDTAKVLETAVVRTSKPEDKTPLQKLNEKYTTGIFAQQARSVIDNETVRPNDSHLDALRFIQYRLTQVQFINGGFYSRHKTTMMGAGKPVAGQKFKTSSVVVGYPVLLYLNEVPIDPPQLQALNAEDIGYVKYFENFVGGGIGAIGGAIAVYLKNHDYVPPPPDYPEYSINAKGFTVTKEFFNPDYGDPAFRQPEKDYRSTLYWNADILVSNGNTAKVKFYNNDFSKKLQVIVEGFDEEGRLIHAERTLER